MHSKWSASHCSINTLWSFSSCFKLSVLVNALPQEISSSVHHGFSVAWEHLLSLYSKKKTELRLDSHVSWLLMSDIQVLLLISHFVSRPCRDCQCWIWQRECYRWLLEHLLKKYKVRLNTDCGGKVSDLLIRNLPKILISLLSLWQEGQQSQLGGTMSCMSRIQATVTLCKCCPTVFPHSSHHMSTSPFMYFQNQNIEKEPSLKVLS